MLPGQQSEHGVVPDHGAAEPLGLGHGRHHVCPGGGIHNQGEHIGAYHTQQNGNDLYHALAPDVAGHHDENGHHGNQPVGAAVADGGAGQRQADADDDGAGDNGREVAHDLACAEGLEKSGKHQIYKTRNRHAEAGVGKQLCIGGAVRQHGSDGGIAAQERKGGAKEGGNFPAGDQMEEQCAETREQQGGGHVQAGQGGNQHRRAEHGEQVLHTQNQCLGGAQLSYVVNRFVVFHKNMCLSFFCFWGYTDFIVCWHGRKPPAHSAYR